MSQKMQDVEVRHRADRLIEGDRPTSDERLIGGDTGLAAVMVVWLACGLLTLCGAMVCAELASAFPYTGGVYVFLRDTFNQFAIDPREAAVGLGLVLAGVPVYYYLCHANR